jgi:kynurenine formamidase
MEVLPNPDGLLFPVHQILLALNGVHILENLATERLAGEGWDTFLFVAAPLPMTGASSSWINPLAIR